MPLDLPMFAADFEPSSLASLPSKTLSNDLSSIRFWYVEVIGCTRSCNRSSNLRGVAERSNISLAFLLFLFLLLLTFRDRCCIFVARHSLCRTSELSTKSRSGSIRGLKCLSNAMSSSPPSSIVLQSAIFLADQLAHLLDFPRDFFMLTHFCHVHAKYRQRLVTLRYRELVKSFSVSSICERTVFVYH